MPSIGYPDEKPDPRPRKSREEIFFLNEFGETIFIQFHIKAYRELNLRFYGLYE